MTNRLFVLVCAVSVVCAVALVAAGPAAAQQQSAWSPSRTADGHPDLQGVWANNNVTPLERPEILNGRETLTDEEVAALQARAGELFSTESGDAAFGDSVFAAALAEAETFTSRDTGTGNYNHFWLVERDWDNRTSLIVDPPNGRLPARTEAASVRLAARAEARRRHAWGPEDRSLGERCISWGAPRLGAGYNSYVQIFQTPDHVVVYMEMGGSRVIPLTGSPHVDDSVRQLHGDSRGRWEGDTLVIDTTNYSPTTYFMGASDGLHVVERLTRVSDDVLQYDVTVTDPTTWAAPWTAMIPLRSSPDPVFEYACHEGNIGMEGIMSGARALEKAEADAAGGGSN
ncbi:MAG: hypothetical protein QF786_03300 [Vicinamibacterales bacterium]|nr:hypothetical protein [Vicinamibacterales bacterium]HJN44107.1 hypothetical protein [Vicinamibacterales bacterium]